MNKRKLTAYQKLLLERKRELLKQVVNQDDDLDELRGDQPADPLDMAGNSSTLELMTTLGNHERVELADIDIALQKIEDKSYGDCEDCGESIAPARLEAIPTARFCVPCKEKHERNPQAYYADRPRRRVLSSDDLPMSTDDDV